MITLKEINSSNFYQVCMLRVGDEQRNFVADNAISLAEAYATRNEGNNAQPFAIYNDDVMVGFVMIGKGTVGNENETQFIKDNYVIWRFMIDEHFQKMGYGRESLEAVVEYIKTFPMGPAQFVWLSYEKDNDYARRFYKRFGFWETGEKCGGELMAILRIGD